MKHKSISRLNLETFTTNNYTKSLLTVQHYPLHSKYFIIQNRSNFPVSDYISPHRREFYKIFHMTSGSGILTIGLHKFEMGPNEIAFIHPDQIMSWQTTSGQTGGHFCLIHPDYFGLDAQHVLNLFKKFPNFKPEKSVIQLTEVQSSTINGYFENMYREDRGNYEDKKQAILLHVQMLLLESQRAGKTRINTIVPESLGYIYRFLSLLESSFQVQNRSSLSKLKTASEFAAQLHVHPNYLNTLVKNHTGKTLREHIQDRILHEAKSLLVQTDWGIGEISEGLGFSGQAAFTSFFTKKESISPSTFRKSSINSNATVDI